jgi:hypothetical protein
MALGGLLAVLDRRYRVGARVRERVQGIDGVAPGATAAR